MHDHSLTHAQFVRPTWIQIFISMMSFSLMGALVGVFTGLVDAIDTSHPVGGGGYVLLGATGLHLLFGGLLGTLIGFFYGLFPDEFGMQFLLRKMREAFLPSSHFSHFHRGRVIFSIWAWSIFLLFLLPSCLRLSLNVTQNIQTPLWSTIMLTAVAIGCLSLALISIKSISLAGARFFAHLLSQVHHLNSLFVASFYPFVLLLVLGGVGLGLSYIIPLLIQFLKSLDDAVFVSVGIVGIATLLTFTIRLLIRSLSSDLYKHLVSYILVLVQQSQRLSHPMIHLLLAGIFLSYTLISWVLSRPPEFELLLFRPALLTIFFFIPLMLGGEYLKPFIRYNSKIWTTLLFLLLGWVGVSTTLAGLKDRQSLVILSQHTVSSAFILSHFSLFGNEQDQDQDGQAALPYGQDCDDQNPNIYKGAPEVMNNDIDENCDPSDDYDFLVQSKNRIKKIQLERQNTFQNNLNSSSSSKDSSTTINTKMISSNSTKSSFDFKVAPQLFDRLEGPYHIVLLTLVGFQPSETDTPAFYKRMNEQMMHFSQMYISSPQIDFNLFSILSGHPASQSIRNQKQPVYYSRASRVLTQTLSKKRYQTLAFIGDPKVSKSRGFAQGFGQWNRPKKATSLKAFVPQIEKSIQNLKLNRRSRFFSWVHLNEFDLPQPKTKAQKQRFSRKLQQFDQTLDALITSLLSQSTGKKTAIFILNLPAKNDRKQAKGIARLAQDQLKAELFVYLPKVSTRANIRQQQRQNDQPISQLALTSMMLDLAEIESYDPDRERLRLDLNLSEVLLGDPIRKHTIYSEIFNSKNDLAYHVILDQEHKIYHNLKTDLLSATKLNNTIENPIDLVDLDSTQKDQANQIFQQFRKNMRLALPKLKD